MFSLVFIYFHLLRIYSFPQLVFLLYFLIIILLFQRRIANIHSLLIFINSFTSFFINIKSVIIIRSISQFIFSQHIFIVNMQREGKIRLMENIHTLICLFLSLVLTYFYFWVIYSLVQLFYFVIPLPALAFSIEQQWVMFPCLLWFPCLLNYFLRSAIPFLFYFHIFLIFNFTSYVEC